MLLIYSSNIFADVDEQKIREVAYSAPWLKILHYKKNGPQKYLSQLDGKNFFVSPRGKEEPFEELRSSIRLFQNDTHLVRDGEKKPSQCVYPSRYHFIREHFQIRDNTHDCPKLKQFMAQFDQKRIYLVFSTAYPNNPASMFGHTFLRLSSSQKNDHGLFDHSISYAAHTPPGEGGVWFAIKGIFGGYRGRFTVLPYYVKLKQYGHMENRDIWEYQINLTPQEITRLLLHVWELEINSYYDYYFFSENCSYHLLTLLEAVRPQLKLTQSVFFLSPPDTIKKVMSEEGLITSIDFRPSYRRTLWRQYRHLDSHQKDIFHSILKKRATTQDTKPLNTAISYYQYKKQSKNGLTEEEEQNLNHLLLERSQLPPESASPSSIKHPDNRPDRGHDRTLFSLALGHGQKSFFQEFYWQSAYHDLLANDQGYEPFSEIIFPSFLLRHQNSRLRLEKINFARIISLTPVTPLETKLSWAMEANLVRERNKPHGYTWNIEFGKGLASHLFHENTLFAAILSLKTQLNSQNYRVGPSLQWFALARMFSRYKTKLHYTVFAPILSQGFQQHIEWGHSYSISQQSEIRLNYLTDITDKWNGEIKVSFFHYY